APGADAGRVLVGVQRGEVRIGAAVEPEDRKVEAFVRAHDLAVTLGRGCNGQARRSHCKCVDKFPTRHHRSPYLSPHPDYKTKPGFGRDSSELKSLAHDEMRKQSSQLC